MDLKKTEQRFLDCMKDYWTEDVNLYGTASWEYSHMMDLKAARLEKKEMEYTETMQECPGAEEVMAEESESTTIRCKRKIIKTIRRHGRTLYRKTQTLETSMTIREDEVESFYYQENFGASLKRYFYIANQIAAFPLVIMYTMMPESPNTLLYRLRDILFCAAVVLPVMWVLAFLACQIKEGLNRAGRRKAEAARNQTEQQIQEKWPQIDVKEMKGVMDTELKLIHFAKEKQELKSLGCVEPERLLVRYEDVCDCSVGAVRFGMAEEGKRRIAIPAEARMYLLKDNGRNLVPKKEIVRFVLEYRGQWRIVEYQGGVKQQNR